MKLVSTEHKFEVKSRSGLSGKGLCELKDSKASEIGEPLSISAEFLLAQHQTSLKLVTKQQTNLLKPESFMGCVGNWPDSLTFQRFGFFYPSP